MPVITRDMTKIVTILMGVLNGAKWLQPQLNSIAEQDHEAWVIRFSDDGSTDLSADIIAGFSEQHPDRVHRGTGPKSGFGDNYMQLIRDLPQQAGYTAFADQDDIWNRVKLGRAVAALARSGEEPALYCGRRWLWYPKADRRIKSSQPSREFGFRNALIENVAAGNTVLLNPAAAQLARQAARMITKPVFAHDWWLYQLITGAGGTVVFDNGPPCILYRQHSANAVGAGHGIAAQIRRKTGVLKGNFARRIKQNLAVLDQIKPLLTEESLRDLRRFELARNAALHQRLLLLNEIRPYRQTSAGTLGFWGAASLGQI
ncbi:glycosyltransferase [Sulfitobacter mediterraneus]|uniref:glycosyltransferase n=2 Tax=Sulfitobacter mediterraneus TaxID=83219 RepID=UPI0019395F96|nr:glycosyltransferase [Sulfitobacter mediterraneus]MBM1570926.1 glycosyltransferase [Sulfitobacter mediterraneus]MBM1574726.1 glycosyltransferase [Sulfitobacter mediterraneus]MBM1578281.1 glycosyltransferase [Sulfitobacter mediterraneus]MBM1582337.1 glycosyltransferase [Sulfitobacter mediterraneus]